jgi:hypothetical protein
LREIYLEAAHLYAMVACQFIAEFFQKPDTPRSDDEIESRSRKFLREHAPDAGRGTGDERPSFVSFAEIGHNYFRSFGLG